MTLRKKIGSEIVSGPEYDRDNVKIVYAILNGATFEKVARDHGVTKQAISKRFWSEVVNLFPMSSAFNENKDVDRLRTIWNEIKG